MSEKFEAGEYVEQFGKKEYSYRCFLPEGINKAFAWSDKEITILLNNARGLLGELNAYSMLVPDVGFFIKMHKLKEANTSSKIEGTKTNMDEIVLPVQEIEPEKRDDWIEVQNYVKAADYAINRLQEMPLSLRLIKESHKVLLNNARGEHKNPGEIRKSQNWIGGSSLSDAFFIPPNQAYLPDLLTDLEKFIHNTSDKVPNLIKIALTHYQFETIHPFLDGNGRIGRLLITLQLMDYGILKKPTLYLSEFFEKHRAAYYDSLNMVRQTNNIEQWLKFFLNGVIMTSQNGIDTFNKIIELRQIYEKKIMGLGVKAERAHKLLIHLFSNPAISITEVQNVLSVTFKTASLLIEDFVNLKILKEITGNSRNRMFVLKDYLLLFK